jgi:hypothetical protein
MTVGVLKVTRISAPKGLLRGFRNPCAGRAGLTHNGVHFALASDVVAEGELGGAPTTGCCHTRIKSEVRTGEKRKLEAMLQIEDNYGAVLELSANNAFALKAQSVPIELQRCLQVIDADRNHPDSRLHNPILLISTFDRETKDAGPTLLSFSFSRARLHFSRERHDHPIVGHFVADISRAL